MDFRVLGPVEVLDNGEPVSVGGEKQRTVLAMLVAAAGDPVSVDRLVEALWGEALPERAKGSIQTYISNLRGLIGDRIDFRGDGYVLEVDPESVDRFRFEALVARGRELTDTDPEEARHILNDALNLWRGPPFADLDEHSALRPIITALEETRLVALETRIEADLATGRHLEVVGELESLCEEFPLRESFRKLHMLALYRAGRQGDALRAFQKTRARLAEMGIEPSTELQELEQQILEHSVSLGLRTSADPRSTVPRISRPRTRLVGRATDIVRVEKLVDTRRLVTLTGAGGSGKTRLAIEIGILLEHQIPDGVFFVDLSSVDDDQRVVQEMGRQMGMRGGARGELVGEPLEEVVTHLSDQEILLIIDNCEHLLEACATVIDELLAKCEALTVLATSREPLGVDGEQVWLVRSLSLVDDGGTGGGAAVELLVDRLESLRPDFDVEGSRSELAMIARRLDGIPLALELAAPRIAHLGASEVLTRLDDRFHLLVGGRKRPQRHQTLQATFDWSHELLASHEQALFWRLAVFAGSFDLEAVRKVCAGPDTTETADAIGALVDKSLVVLDYLNGEPRYRLLETVRMYVQEKLVASGEAVKIRERHRDWYLEWVARHSLDATMNDFRVVEDLEVEYDNLRRSIDWSIDRGEGETAVRFLMHLLGLSYYRGHHEDVRKWAEQILAGTEGDQEANAVARIAHDFTFALDRDAGPANLGDAQKVVIEAMDLLPEDHPARFVACHDLWARASVQFDPNACLHWAMEGQRVSQLAGMRWANVFARGLEGCSYLYAEDFETATEVFGQAFADPAIREWDTGVVPYHLAISAFLSGDTTTARTVVDAVDVDRNTPDPYLLPMAIAVASATIGDLAGARRWMHEAVYDLRSLRWTRPLASREVLMGFTMITLLEQDLTTAMRHLAATRAGTGRPIIYTPGGAVLWRRCADTLKQELDPAVRRRLIEEGKQAPVEQAIDEQIARTTMGS